MVEIELKEGQNGYDVVAEYIRRYWDKEEFDTVVVSIGISYDGREWDVRNEIADTMCDMSGIEFLYDWDEGQKFIRIFGIKAVSKIDVFGGIYKPDGEAHENSHDSSLLDYIQSKGHTVNSLASSAGVSARSLEHYTTGQRPLRNARAWFIVALAKALDTTPEYLLTLDNAEN